MSEGMVLHASGFRSASLQAPFPLKARLERRVGSAIKLPETTDCDISITGISLTGQILAQEIVCVVMLDAPLPEALQDRWRRHCSWYQIVGGSAALQDLTDKHTEMSEARAALLREAQTTRILEELKHVEAYLKRLQEGISYCKIGFLCREPIFYIDSRPMLIEQTLRENGCKGPTHDIDVKPSRVGMGPMVYIRVVCVSGTQRQGTTLDTFQALVPCMYARHKQPDQASRAYGLPGEEYSNLTVGDIARSLQNVYLSRFPLWQQVSPPQLKHYGRILDENRRGEDVFVHHTSGVYTETVHLILNLKPYTPPPPMNDLEAVSMASKEALKMVVDGVMTALANMDDMYSHAGPGEELMSLYQR